MWARFVVCLFLLGVCACAPPPEDKKGGRQGEMDREPEEKTHDTCKLWLCLPGQECRVREMPLCLIKPCPLMPYCTAKVEDQCPEVEKSWCGGSPAMECMADHDCPAETKCCKTVCGGWSCTKTHKDEKHRDDKESEERRADRDGHKGTKDGSPDRDHADKGMKDSEERGLKANPCGDECDERHSTCISHKGNPICVPKEKLGECPLGIEIYKVPAWCTDACQDDYDCPGAKRCCMNSCGRWQCAVPNTKEKSVSMEDSITDQTSEGEKQLGQGGASGGLGQGHQDFNERGMTTDTDDSNEGQNCQEAYNEATSDGIPPGRFVPVCTDSGEWEPQQCWGSTGYCWCVDNRGREREGTQRGPGKERVTCVSAEVDDGQDCQDAYNEATSDGIRIGRFIPQCTDSREWESQQCWASTGYCWCVDSRGREKEDTRRGPVEERVPCI